MNGTSGFQRSAVFFLPITSVSVPAQATASIRKRLPGVLLTTKELPLMAPRVLMITPLLILSRNRIAFFTYKNTMTEHVRETLRVSRKIFVKPEAIHFNKDGEQ